MLTKYRLIHNTPRDVVLGSSRPNYLSEACCSMPHGVTNWCYGACRKSASEYYTYLLLQVTMCIVGGVNCSGDEHRTLSLRFHPPLIKLQKALRFPIIRIIEVCLIREQSSPKCWSTISFCT